MMVTSKKLLEKYHRRSKFVKNLIFFPENFVQKISTRKKNLLYFNTRVILLHYENFNISSTCINNHYIESSVKSPYINPYMHRTTKHTGFPYTFYWGFHSSINVKHAGNTDYGPYRIYQGIPQRLLWIMGGMSSTTFVWKEGVCHYRKPLSITDFLSLSPSLSRNPRKKIPLLTSGHRGQVSIRS